MQQLQKVDIGTLSNGASMERANLELAKVLENIQDINTSPTAKRSVTIKFEIKPSENRDMGEVTIQATSKLAPVVEHTAFVWKQTAIQRIAEYLKANTKVPVIA